LLEERCNSSSYWLCHSEGHVICHFLIIHGGSFGYKMFSILRARQYAWTTTSFRARRIPAPRTPRCLRKKQYYSTAHIILRKPSSWFGNHDLCFAFMV
jgi:hypothetical protein